MKVKEESTSTKEQISAALKSLMRSKTFNKITINDIVNLCQINRRTFYYHFDDKYTLLKWIVKSEALSAVEQLTMTKEYSKACRFVIDYIERNKRFIENAYKIIGRDEFKRLLYDDFYHIIDSVIYEFEKQEELYLESEYKSHLTRLFTHAFAQSILQILNENVTDNEKSLEYVLDIFHLSVKQIINQRGKRNELLSEN